MSGTTSRAEFDPQFFGVRVAVRRANEGGPHGSILKWEQPTSEPIVEAAPAGMDSSAWLHLREDDARAIYEALADHFGHAGHDIRALRKDYDAERARVDKMLANLIGGAK